MDVSIILVNYNTKELTCNCIESIVKYTKSITYEIIVVDNNSSDGSKSLANDNRIRFIESGDNLGFGLANNLGIEHAKGKYVFLLNTDTLLTYNVIHNLYEYMEANSHVGVVGTGLLDIRGENNASHIVFPSLKHTVNLCYQYFLRHSGIKCKNEQLRFKKKIVEVDGVSGADMFIRKDIFEEVRGFDKDIFMYGEEVELQYRIAKLGYQRIILAEEHIIHLEGGSSAIEKSKRLSFFVLYSMLRGKCIYYRRHKSVITRLVFLIVELPIYMFFILKSPYRKFCFRYLQNFYILRDGYKIPMQNKNMDFYRGVEN